jgi:hypothetical protein
MGSFGELGIELVAERREDLDRPVQVFHRQADEHLCALRRP